MHSAAVVVAPTTKMFFHHSVHVTSCLSGTRRQQRISTVQHMLEEL